MRNCLDRADDAHMLDKIPVRLSELIDGLGLTQSVFAESLGLQQNKVSRMINRRIAVDLETLEKILCVYPQVNHNWLFFGESEMFNLQTQTND